MEDRVDGILKQLKHVSPPDDLNAGILSAVRRDRQRGRAIIGLLYAALLATFPPAYLSIKLFASDLAASPVAQLLNLALTDSREVVSSLGIWILALVEALPIGTLALALGSIFILAVLVNRIAVLSGARHQRIREV